MASFAGPNVVEDGLVLALDAGNTQSYPGSGTDLYDCADYSDILDGKPKGSWMVNWYKNIKKREKDEEQHP